MVDKNKMQVTTSTSKGSTRKTKIKPIDPDKMLILVKKLDPKQYPSCDGVIKRIQNYKRKSFILDMVRLVNLCIKSGIDIWE